MIEAFRSGRPIDRGYILDGCQDGPVLTIKREARKQNTMIKYVEKERLDQMSETGRHQGVIACAAAYEYAQIEDMFALAEKRGEPPFFILLDNIEDPHNLGAIIRTANLAGAHGLQSCSGTDSGGGTDFGRGAQLYAGGQGHKSGKDHRRTKGKGALVRLCGYGRYEDVRFGFKRPDRPCN